MNIGHGRTKTEMLEERLDVTWHPFNVKGVSLKGVTLSRWRGAWHQDATAKVHREIPTSTEGILEGPFWKNVEIVRDVLRRWCTAKSFLGARAETARIPW